jgi:hypothetical protein
MVERLVLKPPEIVEADGKVVFLAGPIQGAPDWQSDAIKLIHNLDSQLVVATPRKNYSQDEFIYEKQVDWETHFLNRAAKHGAVMFWLAKQTQETPGRSYAQTSRLELGEWKVRHERDGTILVVGVEEGFGNARYIHRRLSQDCPEVPIMDSLEEVCKKTVSLLEQI